MEGRLSELEALGDTRTRAGWRLADAVRHLASVGGGSLVPLINKHGFPRFCFSVGDDAATSAARPAQQHKEGEGYHTTFVSLARAIVGQQLAGAAVRKIWGRFEAQFTTPGADHRPQISPAAFRRLTSSAAKLEALRSAVGLSGAKARALVSLSDFYADGRLSDAQLLEGSASPDELCVSAGCGVVPSAFVCCLRMAGRGWDSGLTGDVHPCKRNCHLLTFQNTNTPRRSN